MSSADRAARFPERIRVSLIDSKKFYVRQPGGEDTPSYSLATGGSVATPTGMVLIRFREGIAADSRKAAIAAAGYDVSSVLDYAPQAAWLTARSGDIADALNGIDRLSGLPDVENVEPQMLSARSLRE